jgi:hypothetical protein
VRRRRTVEYEEILRVGVSVTRAAFWSDIHGVDMSPLCAEVLAEPTIEVVDPQAIITDRCLLKDFDLMTIRDEELDFEVGNGSSPQGLSVVRTSSYLP